MNIPVHIAIILDGNGRWAKSKGMPRNYGHTVGAKNVENICRACHDLGVKYLTVYAFSTENWSRPGDEVSAIMKLLRSYLKTCFKLADDNGMRVRVLGDLSRLESDMQETIKSLEEHTKDHQALNFQIALNYGSRDELVRAVRRLSDDIKSGSYEGEITEETIAGYLDTKGIPDPDLLIRTSGELRLSNFLLWQCAYTEFYFTDVHWPAFTKEELEKAIKNYSERNRRYGGI